MRGLVLLLLMTSCAALDAEPGMCPMIPTAPEHEHVWEDWEPWRNTGNAGEVGMGKGNQCVWWRNSNCRVCGTSRSHIEIGPCDRAPGDIPYRPFEAAAERLGQGLDWLKRHCKPVVPEGWPLPVFVPPVPVLVP